MGNRTQVFKDYLIEARQGGTYVGASEEDLNQAEKLFQQMFRGEDNDELISNWKKLGFELIKTRYLAKQITIIQEQSDKKMGRGFYAFQQLGLGNALQAPHSESDLHTGAIVQTLFLHHQFAAAGWNTVQRRQADVAHLPKTYFMAFSKAFAKEMPERYLIQLHGFSEEKRSSMEGKETQFIISNGTKSPSHALMKMNNCLRNLTIPTRIYPIDIKELGATTNVIGKMLRSINFQGFIHLEMSAGIRKALIHQPDLIMKLKDCIPE